MDEPSWILRAATYHFASGEALYLGLMLWLLAAYGNSWGWRRSRVFVLSLMGCVWLALSGWPARTPQIAVMGGFACWFIRCVILKPSANEQKWLHRVLGVAILVVLLREYRLSTGETLPQASAPQLTVIGDSITAGLNDGDDTWPQQLARRCSAVVWDASQQGATVKSAKQQLAALGDRGSVLVIEIGGNDLLEGYPVDAFAADLSALLSEAASSNRKLVMFELPLPPLSNRYGYHQRALADQYGVAMIPKRELARVLTTAGSTVDGIHLSDVGQARLAEVVQRTLRLDPADADLTRYHRIDRR